MTIYSKPRIHTTSRADWKGRSHYRKRIVRRWICGPLSYLLTESQPPSRIGKICVFSIRLRELVSIQGISPPLVFISDKHTTRQKYTCTICTISILKFDELFSNNMYKYSTVFVYFGDTRCRRFSADCQRVLPHKNMGISIW